MKIHIRQKYVVGNWKMHMTAFGAEQLAKGVIDGLAVVDDVVGIFFGGVDLEHPGAGLLDLEGQVFPVHVHHDVEIGLL